MAGNILAGYGTSNQAITVTYTSLATGSARASTVVDNTTNKFPEALVAGIIKSGASSTSATGYVNIYAYGTADGGSHYTEGATGSDAAITLTSPTNLKRIGIVNVVVNAISYQFGPFSVAKAFDGVLPDHWGIVVENQCGSTLDASVGSIWYQGVEGSYT